MKTLNLIQGTPEWHTARLEHFTASEAAAMLGVSKYMSRNDLLKLKKTGIQPEVDAATQARFDRGHEVEELALPMAEDIIEDDLYPCVGVAEVDGLPLLASFDGLTMMNDVVWEHKLINERLTESLARDEIPDDYHPQLEQQLLVSGAEKALFMASDGTKDNCFVSCYKSNPELRQRIIDGWKQFQKDLEAFEVAPESEPVKTDAIEPLPVLSLTVRGEAESNLAVYKQSALAFIESINTELVTDEDFANAEKNIKFCQKAEKELEDAKQQALSQTASIDEMFKTIDFLRAELREKRLFLNKLVKTRKEQIKRDMIQKAENDLKEYIDIACEDFGGIRTTITADFPAAIKGKRNLDSLQNAIDTESANTKIRVTQQAEQIRRNLKYMDEHGDYKFLFNDLNSIVFSEYEQFKLIVDARITQHKETERKRLEAERKRIQEEEARKAEAEQKRIQEEAERKAKAEAEAARRKAEQEKQEAIRKVKEQQEKKLAEERRRIQAEEAKRADEERAKREAEKQKRVDEEFKEIESVAERMKNGEPPILVSRQRVETDLIEFIEDSYPVADNLQSVIDGAASALLYISKCYGGEHGESILANAIRKLTIQEVA